MSTTSYRLGIDIGGTFTDIVLLGDDHSCKVAKVLNVTGDNRMEYLGEALRHLLSEADVDIGRVAVIVHATTLATNAVIQRSGADTAMVTTEGFRDILEAGTELVYDVYDVGIEYPAPLVPTERRLTVSERTGPRGDVLVPLDEVGARNVGQSLRTLGVASVAVCFLHSHRSAIHERRMREIIREEFPDVSISLSSDVLPESGEYGRFSSTAIDAYVKPLVNSYLTELWDALEAMGFGGGLRIMRSTGATLDWTVVRDQPASIVESGPAAGVAAVTGLHARGSLRSDHILSFDMGGTTAKVAFVVDGEALIGREIEIGRLQRFRRGSGLLLRLPCVDLLEIGAGGGSLASVDSVGLLAVGPESAGAEPGPACYGRGGRHATVTDADLVLGYLSPAGFTGSQLALDVDLARKAVAVDVGVPLGLEVEEAAAAVHRIVVENMALACQVAAAERGYDLRDFELVAFGGAGPMHAAALAKVLGIERVAVPPAAGVMSSFGCLTAPLAADAIVPSGVSLAAIELDELRAQLGAAKASAAATLRPAGVDESALIVQLVPVLRYRGQRFNTVMVPLDVVTVEAFLSGADGRPALLESFERVYRHLYGRLVAGGDPEIVQWQVRVVCDGHGTGSSVGSMATMVPRQVAAEQPMYFDGVGAVRGWIRDRASLEGDVRGPGIVVDPHSATVVPPACAVQQDAAGFLRVRPYNEEVTR
jgi:5-oxoprolinase (ATP-hydrolysing)